MDGTHLKKTDADRAVKDAAYAVTAGELRQFVERFEALAADKAQASLDQAEVMGEAKAKGYDTKALRHIIKLRKVKPAELFEQESIIAVYRAALGMA